MRVVRKSVVPRRRSFIRLVASAGVWGLTLWRPGVAAQAPGASAPVDDEIRRVSDEWFDALRRTDTAGIERLETDDFLTVQEAPVGVAVIEKATQIASLKSGKGTQIRLVRELSNVRVRRYGDTAILTAVAAFRRDGADAKTPPSRAVITEVWVKQSNRWRIAHFATHPVHDRVRR